jgi:hypothetical protein
MHQAKEAVNDLALFGKAKKLEHEKFGELVHENYRYGQHGDAGVVLSLGCAHRST